MIINTFGCLIDWALTRSWKLILGLLILPMGLVLAFIGLVIGGSLISQEQLAQKYVQYAERELNEKTSTWAFSDADADSELEIPRFTEALFRRARSLRADDNRLNFVIAALLGQRGALSEAMKLMQSLAPNDKAGYLPAHAWIANTLLRTGQARPDDPILQHHLNMAVTWEQAPASIVDAATQLALANDDARRALQLLDRLAETDLRANSMRLRIAMQQGNVRIATETADRAFPRLQEALEAGTATAEERIALKDILVFRGDFAAAEMVLTDGLRDPRLAQDYDLLRRELSNFFCERFTESITATTTEWSGDLDLLAKAFDADPTNPRVAEETAKLARISGEEPPQELIDNLHDFLARAQATSVTHVWLAEAHILRQEYAQAIENLVTVVNREPRAADALNNLAYALALSEPDRLADALQYAQQAIALRPKSADFHDTLGFVLLQLERNTEALAELEIAIELQPSRIDIRERVAEAYRRIGNQEMADLHARIIQQLKDAAQAEKE